MIADLPSNPHCIVVLDGRRFDSWEDKEAFKSVSVELTTNRLSQATFKFFDPDFKLADQYAYIAAGGLPSVTIYMGYGKSLGKPIFEGVVAHIERDNTDTGFIAYDNGFRMKKIKNAEYYYKKDDKDIVGILADRNELSFSPPPGEIKGLEKYRTMTHDEKNDWQFAMERAREMGWILYVRGNTLYARYPAKTQAPIATFINRKNFVLKHGFDFTLRVPESQEGKKLVRRVGRGRGGKRLVGTSNIGNRGKENVNLKRDSPGTLHESKIGSPRSGAKGLGARTRF